MEQVTITKDISYIKSSTEPLSAEVGIIEGKEYIYLYDVGNNKEVSEYLETFPKKKKIILSHFHPDHIGNIGNVSFEILYVGANTKKYLKNDISNYKVVLESILIEDGVKLEIYPMPNSHAKGL